MQGSRIPPQLTRLILTAVTIVAVYIVARRLMTPASYGQYGPFRGAALQENASMDITYAGKAACADCHEEVLELLSANEHQTLSCEGCHGPSLAHVEDPDHYSPAKPDDARCLRCHTASPVKPAWLMQIDPADHWADGGESCIECHLPHSPIEAPPEETETEEESSSGL